MSHILKSDDDATTMDKETISAIIEDTKKEESTAEGSIIVEIVAEEITEVKVTKRKEKYVCEEDKNFLVTFFTTDEWSRTATWTILFIMENL